MSKVTVQSIVACAICLVGVSALGLAQEASPDLSPLADLASRVDAETMERMLPAQKAALSAASDAAASNRMTATNFAKILSARLATLKPETLKAEISTAFGKALQTSDPNVSLALAFQLLPAAYSAGKCVEMEGGASLQCAVAIVPTNNWANSFDGAVGDNPSQQMRASTLDAFAAAAVQGQAAGGSDPAPDANSEWRLDDQYDESRCDGSMTLGNEFSRCDHVTGGGSDDFNELPIEFNYAAIYVLQVDCGDTSCKGWGEIVAVGNVKYLASSDVAAIHLPIGFYCGWQCVLETVVEGLGQGIEDKVFGDDFDSEKIVEVFLDGAEVRNPVVHPSAVAKLHFVNACPIAPAKYDAHPTYDAPEFLQDDEQFQQYAQKFGMTGFGWGTNHQVQGQDGADLAIHAVPKPTRYYIDLLGSRDLITEYQYSSVQAWAPNVTLATAEFPLDTNAYTCAEEQTIAVQSSTGRTIRAYGSMIYEYHGARTLGHKWGKGTPEGLPQVDFAIGFEAAKRLDSLVEDVQPDQFTFIDKVDVYPGTLQTSDPVSVTGFNRSVVVEVSGGSYSKNGLPFTTKPGFAVPGDTFVVQQQTPFDYLVNTGTRLTVGSREDTFTTRTQARDELPDHYNFADAIGVLRGSTNYSNPVTIMGFNATVPVYVVGGHYRKNGGPWTEVEGTAVQGDTFQLRNVASPSFDTLTRTHLQVGDGQSAFRVRTEIADRLPDGLAFQNAANADPDTAQMSNIVTITGINTFVNVNISNGSYSKNGQAFTTTNGSVVAGDTLSVRHTSASTYETSNSTTINVGDASALFTSTTKAGDSTPEPFAFVDQTNIPVGTVRTSNTVTVSGINSPAAVTVTGGTYSRNGAAFISGPGTVIAGDTIALQHSSSASFSTTISTVLTIGGVSDAFSSTTESADTAPAAFSFSDVNNVARTATQTSNTITISGINSPSPISVTGGSYSRNAAAFTNAAGTVVAGDTVAVRHSSSASFSTAVHTTLSIGGVSDTFTSTTEGEDSVPATFTFDDVANVPRSTAQTSSTVTITGINSTATVTVTGGSYSKNGGAYTSAGGTVVAGDALSVQHTSASAYATSTDTTLVVGGISDVFTSTTEGDDAPDAFYFTDLAQVPRGSVQTSNTVTISGLSGTAQIMVSGGSYSKNSGSFTAASNTIQSGDTVSVRHTSSASFGIATDTTLTIGGVSDTFTTTTEVEDTTPNSFTFTDVADVPTGTLQTSNTVVIAGINGPTTFAVSGGSYSKNGGVYETSSGSVVAGDTLAVQHISSASHSTDTHTTLTVGNMSDTFSSTTENDVQPDPFIFQDVSNVPRNAQQTSNTVAVSGITTAVAISVAGGSYSRNGGAFITTAGTVVAGDTVAVRHTSASSYTTDVNTSLTIGGLSDTFTSTSEGPPGVLAFSASSYDKLENFGSSVTISVVRSGGSGGVATVQYATSDGSAVSPNDYTATTGTLTWAAGESGSKTFTVPVKNDTSAEPDEQFQVNITGASGASLGSPSTATITIPCNDGYNCQ